MQGQLPASYYSTILIIQFNVTQTNGRNIENIKGIYLQASSLGTSYASLQEIRNALLDFKESGKFVIAYADSYTQGLYYLSSAADKVLLNPKGMIEWRGIASAPLFYKDLHLNSYFL